MLDIYTINIVEDYLKYGKQDTYQVNIKSNQQIDKNYIIDITIKHKQLLLNKFSIHMSSETSNYNILCSLSKIKYKLLDNC